MVLECGMSCIKYLLFAFNVVFALSGVTLMVVGACVLHDIDRFRAFLEISYLAPPIVFIVVGVIVFVISFMGCCGAINESPCKLGCFAGLLSLVLVSEIAAGVLAYAGNDRLAEELRKSMKASKDTYDPHVPADKTLWDEIQSGLGCCGVDGPDDWLDIMNDRWPASCCVGFDPTVHKDHICNVSLYVYKIGCYKKLKNKLTENAYVVLGVACGIAFVQIVGIILSCVLASEILSERKRSGRHGG